jgi:hypothetical protein
MIIKDDRTPEQKLTHFSLIGGVDTVMSGWGKAEGGKSIARWAATPEHADAVLKWVESRGDIKNVSCVNERIEQYRPSGTGHCRIYVVTPGHTSLQDPTPTNEGGMEIETER